MVTKIMPVGDSLTSVTWVEGGVEKYALGYKGVLYNALDDAGYDIDYVGPRTAGAISGQRDPHHAAWEGRETAYFQPLITGYMQTYQPDVVTIMLGTNDVWSNRNITTSLANLRDIVSKVYAVRPDAHVVLCTLAHMNTGQTSAWSAYNAGVRQAVTDFKAAGRRITLADVATVNPNLQGDGVHWTTGGHQSVAAYLKPIMESVLSTRTDTWFSGQSGEGSDDGAFAAWVGSGYATEILGVWADTGPVEQQEVYGATTNWSRPLDIAVGAIWKDQGETWAAAANGDYDARWTAMFQSLAAGRAGKSTTYVRFAHEFSLSYFPWSVVVGEEADFKAAWVRMAGLRDLHFPAAKLVWCPNDGTDTDLDIRDCYPGAAYVDVHGADSYNAYPALNAVASIQTRFDAVESNGAPRGLNQHLAFAVANGKKLAIPEWSSASNPASPYNGMDAPVYMQFFWDWLVTNGGDIEYEILFNVAGYAQGYQLYPSSDSQPLAAAKYRSLWATKRPAPLPDAPVDPPPPGTDQPAGETLASFDFTGANGASLPATLIEGLTKGGATGVINSNQARITTGTAAYGSGQFSRRVNLTTPTADSQQCVVYTRRSATGVQEFWLGARVEDNLDGRLGYWLKVTPELNTWAVYKMDGAYGSTVIGQSQSLTAAVDVPIRMCFRVVGSSIRAKVWTGATEPTTWAVDEADSTHATAGALGFMVRAGAAGSVADLDDYVVTNGSATVTPPPAFLGTFEDSAEGWTSNSAFGGYDVAPDPVRTTVGPITGAGSLLATWPAAGPAGKSWVNAPAPLDVEPGKWYTATADVKVPAGSPDVYLDAVFRARTPSTSVKDAVVSLSVDFLADDSGDHFIGVGTTSPAAGTQVRIDNVKVGPRSVGDTNQPPFVSKGEAIRWVNSGEEFTLTGWSAGDPEHLPVVWAWDPGLGLLVANGDTPNPTFRAPNTNEQLLYEVTARVTDPGGASGTAAMFVAVGPVSVFASRNADGSLTYYRLVSPGSEPAAVPVTMMGATT